MATRRADPAHSVGLLLTDEVGVVFWRLLAHEGHAPLCTASIILRKQKAGISFLLCRRSWRQIVFEAWDTHCYGEASSQHQLPLDGSKQTIILVAVLLSVKVLQAMMIELSDNRRAVAYMPSPEYLTMRGQASS